MRAMLALVAIAIPAVLLAADPPKPAIPTGIGPGYLDMASVPVSVNLAPPPPAPGSGAEARDIEAQRAALALHGTPRWALATADADVFTARATNAFSCAAGIAIGPATTPKTDALLRKTFADFGLATRAIKRKYQRPRPFMVNNAPQCTPEGEAMLRHDGSYPSGHSTIGYGWGAVLAQLLPARATELIARGRAFGDSRRVCNVHWLSDVEEGRIPAAVILARLNAHKAFQKDLAAAARELARATAMPENCAAEAAALALSNGNQSP
jgi:acid phosphatase (class A)